MNDSRVTHLNSNPSLNYLRHDVRGNVSDSAARISGFQNKTPNKQKKVISRVCREVWSFPLSSVTCLDPPDPPHVNQVHLQQVQTKRMSTTSQKHRDFVGEPMGDKPVTALSGIGETLGKKLEGQGFDKASVVLGQFLLLKKDPEMFVEWIKDVTGANSRQAGSCAQCLREWCDSFL
ncbi:barrier-to-autointegration factor-like isoform X2 [Notolabrus celidotus]|uniref:barrier-to-autointegration factor-like isoform X2 n=1 Tax=Notolabrus celidotus TaxID=1203425 RepID=UPI0014902206|nr:barrier-to-autointegration factor-like isoform X2 [Notolabrus celidotus]